MRKYLLFSIIPLLLFAVSCKRNSGNKFQIVAHIKGMPPMDVTMRKVVGFQSSSFVDSTISGNTGNFELSGSYTESGLYSIRLGSNFITVVIDQPKMSLEGNWKDLSDLQISGSPATASLFKFNRGYVHFAKQLIGLRAAHDSLMKNNAPDSVLKDVELNTNRLNKELVSFVEGFADSVKSLPVAIYAASNLLTSDETAYLQKFSKQLKTRFSDKEDNTLLKDFKTAVQTKIASSKSEESGPAVGSAAPDFEAKTLDGKQVSLNDFKGKYVLLDFWASWCPPCRAENPNVVTAYNTYKNRNFTILSFSLDTSHSNWKAAVQNDRLTWTQASDLKGWPSPVASLYGVEAIPMNFLIGPDGKIIARNLRGSTLETTLQHQLPQTGKVQKDLNNVTAGK